MSGPDTATRFDAWASTYEHSVLQPTLYVPAQQRALQLVRQLMPRPQRLLDVGCGTGRLLRQARHQYPEALLVGIDTAWGMVASAAATTNAELAIHHVRAAALPAKGLLVVGCDRLPWFRLPDIHVIAARKPLCPDSAPPKQP